MEFTSEITVRLVQSVGNDSMIVAAAKVSTSGEEALTFTDQEASFGLLNYLMKYRHGTPFEHSSMTFFIHAPIFVWREWHRHRVGFSYNEQSGRYTQLNPVFYIPSEDRPMFKVDGWKPGRPKFLSISNQLDEATYCRLCRNLREVYCLAYTRYRENLELGIDPGLARDCLPVGIYSSCWVTCNPRSLMAFLSLRTSNAGKSYPLYEIEAAAKKCEAFFATGWPLTYKAFVENSRVAP